MFILPLYRQGVDSAVFYESRHLHPELAGMPICDKQSLKKHVSHVLVAIQVCSEENKGLFSFFCFPHMEMSFHLKDIDTLHALAKTQQSLNIESKP